MMKTYERYRPSGVDWLGDIPEHWRTKRLKFVAKVQSSNVDKKSFDNEIPVLLCNYVDVYKNEFIDDNISFMNATASEAEIEKFILNRGDVLITKDSETPDDIANPALVVKDFENVLCGYHLAQIKPNKIELSGRYLLRLLQSPRFNSYFEVSANGITRYGLPIDSITDVFVSLPSPDEQTAIADYLDEKTAQLDSLINKKLWLIELLKEERTAIINQAVTRGVNPHVKLKPSGIVWLGDIPEHWKIKKLKFIAEKVLTGSTPSSNREDYYEPEVNWFTPSDFSDKMLLSDSKRKVSRLAVKDEVVKMFPANSVLLVGIGATLGKVGYIENSASSNQQITALTMSSLEKAKFYAYFFYVNQPNISALANSATLAILNQAQTKDIPLVEPPPDEQKEIVEFIETATGKVDATMVKIEKEISFVREYRAALISEVVTGKIKVV